MKQFLTLEYDPDHPLEWRIVLAEEINPDVAKFLHPMNGMTQDAFNAVPDGFGWLPHLIACLRAETEIPVDLSHIFGVYDENELAAAMKKATE